MTLYLKKIMNGGISVKLRLMLSVTAREETSKQLVQSIEKLSTINVEEFVIEHVNNNHVILWLHSDGNCDHWVVVVGLEYLNENNRN